MLLKVVLQVTESEGALSFHRTTGEIAGMEFLLRPGVLWQDDLYSSVKPYLKMKVHLSGSKCETL